MGMPKIWIRELSFQAHHQSRVRTRSSCCNRNRKNWKSKKTCPVQHVILGQYVIANTGPVVIIYVSNQYWSNIDSSTGSVGASTGPALVHDEIATWGKWPVTSEILAWSTGLRKENTTTRRSRVSFGAPGSDRITISRSPRRGLTKLAIDGAQHSHDEVRSENHTHKRAPDAGAKAQQERMIAPEARTTLTR
ncbi:unnamed protein product [Trichogramma brassicae]|uniref:Uncharacterized protein n=1 Tax=Trichogramma brassicae TaxID=86971 RepID=A0A6H5I613_9HYME|nr:unnamed protein product [Trichogramma brassicae]